MAPQKLILTILYVVLAFWPIPTLGQEKEKAIDPQTKQILKQMGDYLMAAQQFSFHAEATYDQVLESGQKLQQSAVIDVSVRRPNRFYVNRSAHLGAQQFWYDGKTITLQDETRKFYAEIDVPNTIDKALDYGLDHFAITAPLSDFALSDPYTALIKDVQSGFYVGSAELNGVPSHHLAFTQKDMDWQIWIEDGKRVVPRKIVITYKKVKGSPQFAALLSDWDLTSKLPDGAFRFTPKEGYERIKFLPVPVQSGQEN